MFWRILGIHPSFLNHGSNYVVNLTENAREALTNELALADNVGREPSIPDNPSCLCSRLAAQVREVGVLRLGRVISWDGQIETIMDIAGHVSRQMLSRYSHIRMEAKRKALEGVGTKPVQAESAAAQPPAPGQQTTAATVQ